MSATPFFVFVLLSKSTRRIPERKGGKVSEPGSHVGALLLLAPFRALWWCPPRSCAAEAESYAGNVCRGAEVFLRGQKRQHGKENTQLLSVSDFGEVEDPDPSFSIHVLSRFSNPLLHPLLFKRKAITGAGGNRNTFSIFGCVQRSEVTTLFSLSRAASSKIRFQAWTVLSEKSFAYTKKRENVSRCHPV